MREAALAAALMAAFRAAAQRAAALATMAFVTTASTAGFVAPVISLSSTVVDSVSIVGFTIPATGMGAAQETPLAAAATMAAEAMAAPAAAIAAAAMFPPP
jgi:hypothetical protein